MAFNTEDTICAIASVPAGAARGIVRVSGPAAVAIAAGCFKSSDNRPIGSIRHATSLAGSVRLQIDSKLHELHCELFLWPMTRSYTREPVAELHTLGSAPVLGSLLNRVCQLGARLAEPGEFTLRAFLAGRLDLTQAEAVLGVIDARGSEDLNAALVQLAGGLARPLHQLRDELLQLLAELEAGLDFVDEDIEFISPAALHDRLKLASRLLDQVAGQMVSRHVASDLPRIVLVGPPNAGKSSLFNALVERFGRDASLRQMWHAPALVSPRRGTTRDYLTVTVSLHGLNCELVDTAGIDMVFDNFPKFGLDHSKTRDSVIGDRAQFHTFEQGNRATIRVYCVETAGAADESAVQELISAHGSRECDILVLTKVDRLPNHFLPTNGAVRVPVVCTSTFDGRGLSELSSKLISFLVANETVERGHVVAATADRCRESVRAAQQSLQRASELVRANGGNELVAVELRGALDEIGRVVGAVYTDDLLDRIFGAFCIGK